MQISEIFAAPVAEQSAVPASKAPEQGGFKSAFLQQWQNQNKTHQSARESSQAQAKSDSAETKRTPENLDTEAALTNLEKDSELRSATDSSPSLNLEAPVQTENEEQTALQIAENFSEIRTVNQDQQIEDLLTVSVPNPDTALTADTALIEISELPSEDATIVVAPVLTWEDWYRIQSQSQSETDANLELNASNFQDETLIVSNEDQEQIEADQLWAFASLNPDSETVAIVNPETLSQTVVFQQDAAVSTEENVVIRAFAFDNAFQSKASKSNGVTSSTQVPYFQTAQLNPLEMSPTLFDSRPELKAVPITLQQNNQNQISLSPVLAQALAELQSPGQKANNASAGFGESNLVLQAQPLLGYSSSGQATVELPQTLHQSTAASALADRYELMQQLGERIRLMHSSARREIEMQLKPAHLGKITIQLQQEAQHFNLQILAESPLTKQLIEAHLQQLKEQFMQQGFDLQNVQVDLQDQSQTHQESNRGSSEHSAQQTQPLFSLEDPDSHDTDTDTQTASTALINTLA